MMQLAEILLLLLLLTAIQLSLGGSSTYTSTDKTKKNIHKRNNIQNTVQTIQNTVNTSTHIIKTPTHYKTHTYTHPYITKRTHTHTHTYITKRKHTHTHTHTLQNAHLHTPTHYKTHTYTHPHITKPKHTHTHTLQNAHIHTPTHYKTHTYTHPHITKRTHTPTHYKTHTYTYPHITQPSPTHTHTLQTSRNNHNTRYTQNQIVTIQSGKCIRRQNWLIRTAGGGLHSVSLYRPYTACPCTVPIFRSIKLLAVGPRSIGTGRDRALLWTRLLLRCPHYRYRRGKWVRKSVMFQGRFSYRLGSGEDGLSLLACPQAR